MPYVIDVGIEGDRPGKDDGVEVPFIDKFLNDKCQKVCAFGAITIENNLAYIDPQKCKLCRKCVNECPTGAIVLAGMDPLPKVPKAPAAPKASPAAKEASAGVPTAPDAGATPAVSAAETPKAE